MEETACEPLSLVEAVVEVEATVALTRPAVEAVVTTVRGTPFWLMT